MAIGLAALFLDQPVVVYCQSGNRSRRAASMLKDAGYTASTTSAP